MLAVVSGALRDWLRSRGVRTEGLELRALVPVSVRAEDERGMLGNQIVAMRGPLPVYVEDPVARLRVVRQSMDDLKESKQAVGASLLAGAQGFAPPTVLAQASRLNFSTRLFNLIVTNIPGPQFPLYIAGRRLLQLYPIAFLPRNHALAIAIMSYNGEHQLRAARRLRRAARHRHDRRRARGLDRRADADRRARQQPPPGASNGGARRRVASSRPRPRAERCAGSVVRAV